MRGWEAVGQERLGNINHKLNAKIIKCFCKNKLYVGLRKWAFCLGCLYNFPSILYSVTAKLHRQLITNNLLKNCRVKRDNVKTAPPGLLKALALLSLVKGGWGEV